MHLFLLIVIVIIFLIMIIVFFGLSSGVFWAVATRLIRPVSFPTVFVFIFLVFWLGFVIIAVTVFLLLLGRGTESLWAIVHLLVSLRAVLIRVLILIAIGG